LATFHYKAYTERGAVTAGTIVAEGLDAAIDALYGSGLTPFETHGVADQTSERSSLPSASSREVETSIWKRELIHSNRFSL
jgi:general secretion pathway protein F